MTDKFRPELALFSVSTKNNTTPNIALSKSSGGSGTITLEQPVELSIEKPTEIIPTIPLSETIDSQPLGVAASGTITKEQSKEINQDEAEEIGQEIIDIPDLIHPVIEEDIYPMIKDNLLLEIIERQKKIVDGQERLVDEQERLNKFTVELLTNIINRLEILENKKSFINKVITWMGDKIKWR